jgi:hypothetical protein
VENPGIFNHPHCSVEIQYPLGVVFFFSSPFTPSLNFEEARRRQKLRDHLNRLRRAGTKFSKTSTPHTQTEPSDLEAETLSSNSSARELIDFELSNETKNPRSIIGINSSKMSSCALEVRWRMLCSRNDLRLVDIRHRGRLTLSKLLHSSLTYYLAKAR